MAKYEVRTPIEHDGKTFTKGDKVELTKEQAKDALAARAVLPNTAEDELHELAEPVAGDDSTATPAARREAEERGINLTDVEGSGPGGQVTAADVKKADKGS